MVDFFRKAWRGEAQLWKVLLLFWVPFGLHILYIGVFQAPTLADSGAAIFWKAFEDGLSKSTILPTAAYLIQLGVFAAYCGIVLRCAKNTEKKVYGTIATALIVLGLIGFISTLMRAREYVKIEHLYNTVINKEVLLRNDFITEIDAIGWAKILNPERVKQDQTMTESWMMVEKAKTSVGKFRTGVEALFQNAQKNIGTLSVSDNSRQNASNTMTKSHSQIDNYLDIDLKIITEFEDIFSFLTAIKGTWTVNGDNILFSNDSDLNEFNSYIATIQKLVNQEKLAENQPIDTMNEDLLRLKN